MSTRHDNHVRTSRTDVASVGSSAGARLRRTPGLSSFQRTWSDEALALLWLDPSSDKGRTPPLRPLVQVKPTTKPPRSTQAHSMHSKSSIARAPPAPLIDQASTLLHESTHLVASAVHRAQTASSRAARLESKLASLEAQLVESDAALEETAEEVLALRAALDTAERRREAAEQRAGMLGIILGSIFAALSERIARMSWYHY
ncbi:hypothetical protein PUNSTDRAFT_135603 [Punctularia strigosozonata HHB-11173 SS5]|uniref:uncharacterized protein n=1 Tax=Punctularia strigosozonata (strain HHB-11173) TaxID=741275 RepID=UPI0004416ED6|nr:uncharacterized protein PUNSTDRAFT_135603 [Punctularia strigosozonata HHB-11173 SS5]EIN08089.1 hypothetical protein PUNSTDRAFT_135603 [Punctularia strigosozonata HHB-11173 SS5]